MSVVIYHAYIGYVSQLAVGEHAASDYWLRLGAAGVHVFFVISGYIMYLTNFAKPVPFRAGRFLVRRLIRIFPTYWTFVALYLAVQAALRIVPPLSAGQFMGVLALAPAEAPLVIGPAWTLSFEIYFYLVFGLVMILGERRGIFVLTASLLASVALGALLRPSLSVAQLITNSLLLEFVAGVWIARLTTRRPWPRWLGWFMLAGGTAGFAAGLFLGYDRLPSAISWGGPSALLIAGAVILELTAANGSPGIVRRLSWLGDSSYSLYLCHTIVITLIVAALRAMGSEPSLPLLVAITTLGCIALAARFYDWLEKPMIRKLHQLTETKRLLEH